MGPWWPLPDHQRRPRVETGPHLQPPCPATLTRLASSRPATATGADSRGRCHSPGPRLPAGVPAWPASAVTCVAEGPGQRLAAAALSIRPSPQLRPRPRLAARRPAESAPANGRLRAARMLGCGCSAGPGRPGFPARPGVQGAGRRAGAGRPGFPGRGPRLLRPWRP